MQEKRIILKEPVRKKRTQRLGFGELEFLCSGFHDGQSGSKFLAVYRDYQSIPPVAE